MTIPDYPSSAFKNSGSFGIIASIFATATLDLVSTLLKMHNHLQGRSTQMVNTKSGMELQTCCAVSPCTFEESCCQMFGVTVHLKSSMLCPFAVHLSYICSTLSPQGSDHPLQDIGQFQGEGEIRLNTPE